MPALQHIRARSLQPSEAWRGKVAQGCKIEQLELYAAHWCLSHDSDDILRNLPTMPALQRFQLSSQEAEPGSQLYRGICGYQHLAEFLKRHTTSLETIEVKLGT